MTERPFYLLTPAALAESKSGFLDLKTALQRLESAKSRPQLLKQLGTGLKRIFESAVMIESAKSGRTSRITVGWPKRVVAKNLFTEMAPDSIGLKASPTAQMGTTLAESGFAWVITGLLESDSKLVVLTDRQPSADQITAAEILCSQSRLALKALSASRAVSQTSDELAVVQESTNQGLLVVDKQGRVMRANQQFRELLGGKLSDGQSLSTVLDQDWGGRIRFDMPASQVVEKVKNGNQVTFYAELASPDEVRHLQIIASPIQSEGSNLGAVITTLDVTPLVEKTIEANSMAQKAQRHSRELSELAELSSVYGFRFEQIFQKNLSSIVRLLDSTAVSIYLYDPPTQKLIRMATTTSFNEHPLSVELDQDDPVARVFVTQKQRLSRGEETILGQNCLLVPIMFQSKALGVMLASHRKEPYSEHDSKLLRLVANRLAILIENANLYHDVNARRERWEAVFKFTEEGIVIFNRRGVVVGFNPACAKLTGVAPAEAVGRPFGRVIKPASPDSGEAEPIAALAKVLEEGEMIANSEQLLESKSGKRIWTEISYSPIFDAAGQVTSGIAIIRNTQKDREVEEIKSDFISIVSHELRTPLSAIKGFLSMVLKKDFGDLNEKQFHYLNRVYQSNQRMIDLVEDLLDVSYIESGKINLAPAPLAMEGLINDVVTELANKGFERQIMLKVNRRHRLPLVLADETRLRQILTNLVDNAIKYSLPKTEVLIDFRVMGDDLVTSVTDQGVGITPNQIDRIFQKFGRIYNPMSIQAGGTGLGLYIVKNLVESHKGRIWVTSREGRGSKFSFSLPIAKQLPLLS